MLQSSSLNFLKKLKRNNNKPWFDAHRAEYEDARNDFQQFIQSLIDQHGKKDSDLKGLIAKNCLFRINRDIRFSKDKSPYKSNFGASMAKGGKKSPLAGYYFHLEPGRSFAGGGIWMPMPEELRKIRQEIDYNYSAFKKIIESRNFKSIYGNLDSSKEYLLSRVPKGYTPDNPAAEFLKLKSYIAIVPLEDKVLLSSALLHKTLKAFEALQPLNKFVNESIS